MEAIYLSYSREYAAPNKLGDRALFSVNGIAYLHEGAKIRLCCTQHREEKAQCFLCSTARRLFVFLISGVIERAVLKALVLDVFTTGQADIILLDALQQ